MARLFPDVFYVNGVAIPATYFQGLDSAQTAGLDGDAGNGTWNPSSAIQVTGVAPGGMWACSTWTLSPPSTGTVQVSFTALTPLTHEDSDYIELATAHNLSARFIHTPMAQAKDASGCPTIQSYTAPNGGTTGGIMGPTAVWGRPAQTFGMRNCPIASYPYRPGGQIVLPMNDCLHQGATIISVTFYFTISGPSNSYPARTALPDVFPQFRVSKVDIAGNRTPLYTGTNTGFIEMPSPGSVSNYYVATTCLYNCDTNTVVDLTKYSYFAEIIDESGANAMVGNLYLSAWPRLVDIPDMRPQ